MSIIDQDAAAALSITSLAEETTAQDNDIGQDEDIFGVFFMNFKFGNFN